MELRGFHAHIYFDADELDKAKAFAFEAREKFGLPVGHFHTHSIGPHPRGSCQISLRIEQLTPFTLWATKARGDLTIFVHGVTGDHKEDHTQHVIWFGPSEPIHDHIFA